MVSKTTDILHSRNLVLLSIVAVLMTLFFGLRPKGLTVHNQVHWLDKAYSIHIDKYGMAYSDVSDVISAYDGGREFSILFAFRPASVSRGEFKSLLMVHGGSDDDQLIIGQWKSSLIVMNGDDYDNRRRTKKLFSGKQALKPGMVRLICIVSSVQEGTKLYIDGALAAERRELRLDIPMDNGRLDLVVGNSVYGEQGCEGEFRGMAFFGRVLVDGRIANHYRVWSQERNFEFARQEDPLLLYLFNDAGGDRANDASISRRPLKIPARLSPLRRVFLSPPGHQFKLDFWSILDIVLNFIWFIPVGWLFHALLRKSSALNAGLQPVLAISACLLLSLFIETAQTWMPSRSSSLLDLLLNTLGATMGVGLWYFRSTQRRE